MQTPYELDTQKIESLYEEHKRVGQWEERIDLERTSALLGQYHRIADGYRTEGFPDSHACALALQALVDAGYRAGKRAERARRKAAA